MSIEVQYDAMIARHVWRLSEGAGIPVCRTCGADVDPVGESLQDADADWFCNPACYAAYYDE